MLWISAPIVAFAIVGGFLNGVIAREDTYQHLKIFDDVVELITSNYVDKVDVDKVMGGAMHGLADSLDPDSAFLSPAQVKQIESNAPLPAGDVGLDLTRQYYLARHRGARRLAGGEGRPQDRRLRPRHRRARRRARCRCSKACARLRGAAGLEGVADRSSAAAPTIRTSWS